MSHEANDCQHENVKRYTYKNIKKDRGNEMNDAIRITIAKLEFKRFVPLTSTLAVSII